jgi:hypothetical protein
VYVPRLTAYLIMASLICVPDNVPERHPPFLFRFSAHLVHRKVCMYYASSSIEGRCAIFLVIDTVVSSTYSHELAWIQRSNFRALRLAIEYKLTHELPCTWRILDTPACVAGCDIQSLHISQAN